MKDLSGVVLQMLVSLLPIFLLDQVQILRERTSAVMDQDRSGLSTGPSTGQVSMRPEVQVLRSQNESLVTFGRDEQHQECQHT